MADDIITPYLGPAVDGLPVMVCQPAPGGGLCGCEEDDDEPQDCKRARCDC